MKKHFLGLRTVIYPAKDLEAIKNWYIAAFNVQPYFDEPFYVGFNIGGFELGLDPNAPVGNGGGTQAYWGVEDIDAAVAHLTSIGASVVSGVEEVGEGIRVATLHDPFGNLFCIIENPHFTLGS